jgi:NAD(P)-dependent dehydrogenase (short-subunit alcohol dehydrogenase family)
MVNTAKTVIVTGGSQGIGSSAVQAFLDRDYNVVATSRNVTKSKDLPSSPMLALVDGDIGEATTAARVAETAISTFGSIDSLVNSAGIFFTKSFTDYTAEDFKRLVSTNVDGFIYITQLAIKQMLRQKSSGSIVSITAALADNPIAGLNASISWMTKGGINAITRSLAIEYAKDGIRVNAVAPGVVDTPLNRNSPKDFLKTLSPMGIISNVQEIVDAVIYLTEAPHVTGEVLHVDGGAHIGKW